MAEKPTASQLNKLGERLRKGRAKDDDIRALNDFRESFRPAFERVVGELESLGLAVGGRAAKTMGSIVAKLEREKTRLPCRTSPDVGSKWRIESNKIAW
jgi:hypothetical protein